MVAATISGPASVVLQHLLKCCTGLLHSVVADMQVVGELIRASRCCLAVSLPNDAAAWHPESHTMLLSVLALACPAPLSVGLDQLPDLQDMYLARRARREARKSSAVDSAAAVDSVVFGEDSEGFSSEEDEEASLEEETDAEPTSANMHESAGMSYPQSHRRCINHLPLTDFLHAMASWRNRPKVALWLPGWYTA